MRIALLLGWANDGTLANVVGDHIVAVNWQRELIKLGHDCIIETPVKSGAGQKISLPQGADVVIHFHHWLPLVPRAKNIFYLQNSWPRCPQWPNGTVGVFQGAKFRYDGFIFASDKLMRACETDGCVMPFAADPNHFKPTFDPEFSHPICFVGNDIRGDEANDKCLVPLIERGLVIYGGPYRDPRLQAVNRGRVSDEYLPRVYSSAKVNINFTMSIAFEYDLINMRLYESMACGATILSDFTILPFGGITMASSDFWLTAVEALLCERVTDSMRKERRQTILDNHTWRHRVEVLIDWLKGVV